MDSVSLASYIIRLKNKNGEPKNEFLIWDNIYGDQQNLFDLDEKERDFIYILKNNLKANEGYKIPYKHKLITLVESEVSERFFYGQVKVGTYGKEVTTKHVNTEEVGIIEKEVALEKPFAFLFYLPENNHEGILILQRIGNDGIKEVFERWIIDNVVKKHFYNNPILLTINEYFPKKVLNKYIELGDVVSFEFLEKKSHKDGVDGLIEELNDIKAKFVYKMIIDEGYGEKAKRFINKFLKEESFNIKGDKSFIELNNRDNYIFKAEIDIDGKNRVFDMSFKKSKPYMNITNSVNLLETGHPNIKQIYEIAKEHAKYLLS